MGVCVAAADQAIKALIRRSALGAVLLEIPGVVRITHSVNTGAAFSLFAGHPAQLALVSLALLAALLVYVRTQLRLTRAAQLALGCLLGGGAGNLIDRIAFSGVTDYIMTLAIDFPIFNLADIAITLSVAALLVLLMAGKLEDDTGEEHGADH